METLSLTEPHGGTLPVPTTYAALIAVFFLTLGANAQAPSSPPSVSYIRAGHLYDPATGHYRDNVTLAVANAGETTRRRSGS